LGKFLFPTTKSSKILQVLTDISTLHKHHFVVKTRLEKRIQSTTCCEFNKYGETVLRTISRTQQRVFFIIIVEFSTWGVTDSLRKNAYLVDLIEFITMGDDNFGIAFCFYLFVFVVVFCFFCFHSNMVAHVCAAILIMISVLALRESGVWILCLTRFSLEACDKAGDAKFNLKILHLNKRIRVTDGLVHLAKTLKD